MTDRPILFSAPMIRVILREIAAPGTGKTRRRLYVRRGQDPNAPEHLARRLANGLDAAEPGECWEWKRTHNGQGYGELRVAGRMVYAHRLAFELAGGTIPEGLHILHECDNPRCINPEHLTVGTRSKNMRDCHARGRSKIPSPKMHGEANGASKLKASDVSAIRKMLGEGLPQASIAQKFGVSQSNISRIKRGKGWT